MKKPKEIKILPMGKEMKQMWRDCMKDYKFHLAGFQIEVCEAFALYMQQQKISQSEMARRLGINRSAVHKFMSGKQNLTLETIAKYAVALGVDPKLTLKFYEIKEDYK
jgi:predicted XRE-type DNA-binding protein